MYFISKFRPVLIPKISLAPQETDLPNGVTFPPHSLDWQFLMVLYQSLQVVPKPYRGFSSSQDTFPYPAPYGSWEYVSRFKGPDLKNALGTSIARKFHFRYAITDRRSRMLCHCTVGDDAFVSTNSWNPFTHNTASNFRFPSAYATVLLRPAAIGLFFIVYTKRPSISDPFQNSREGGRIKVPRFPTAPISILRAASPYLL